MIEQRNSQSSLVRPDSLLLPLQNVMREAEKSHAVPVITDMTVDALCEPARIAAFDTHLGRIALLTGTRKQQNHEIYYAQICVRPDVEDLQPGNLLRIPTLLLTAAQALSYHERHGVAYEALPSKVRAFALTEVMDTLSGRKLVFDESAGNNFVEDEIIEDIIYRLCGDRTNIPGLKRSVAELAQFYPAVPVTYYDLGPSHFTARNLPVLPEVSMTSNSMSKSA